MNIWLTIIAFLYACTGIVATAAYIPTIRDLWKGKPSANISSYIIWTSCIGITVLYSFFVISDLLLELVTSANFIACSLTLLLALRLKYGKKRKK